MAKSNDRVQAFANPLLERLSRVHPALPVCVWGPIAVVFVVLGYQAGQAGLVLAAFFGAGLFVWTFTEYVMHRWVFHWEAGNAKVRDFFYPMHRLHHDAQEWDRLVMPPLLAVPLWLSFLGIFWLLLGAPSIFPFYAGFTIGYLIYDYIHFYTHFGRPRMRIGKALRRRHLQHHFVYPDRWYGVSSPLWDFVFRTHARRDADTGVSTPNASSR